MPAEGDLTPGGGHTTPHTDDVSQNCTLEAYIILLTNVTLMNLTKETKSFFINLTNIPCEAAMHRIGHCARHLSRTF